MRLLFALQVCVKKSLNVLLYFTAEPPWGWAPHALTDLHLNLKPNLDELYNGAVQHHVQSSTWSPGYLGKKAQKGANTEHVINMWVSVTWITLNNTLDQDQTCADTIVDVS